MNEPAFRLERATERDLGLILRFIKELGAYEQLSHEVTVTEEELRDAPFEVRRKIIEALDIRGEVIPKDGGRLLRSKWYKHSQDFGLENRVANSSASESAVGPWSRSRSRGCSLDGNSFMRRW